WRSKHPVTTKNPVEMTEQNLKEGAQLYLNNCAVCHGFYSPEMSSIAKGLYLRPPDLARDDLSGDEDGSLYWIIEHGVRMTAMPSYAKTLSETEKWQIVDFLKSVHTLPPAVDKYWKSVAPFQVKR
ncbi:MAG: c-type cytochrome, partial [Terriglobales bacterium]